LVNRHLAKVHLAKRHFFDALFGQHFTLSVGQPMCVGKMSVGQVVLTISRVAWATNGPIELKVSIE